MKNKIRDLGKVTKRYVSGMMETDKGNKFPSHGGAEIGDQLVKVGRQKLFMKKDAFAEIAKVQKAEAAKAAKAEAKAQADADAEAAKAANGGGES